jgi:hypothetical protein
VPTRQILEDDAWKKHTSAGVHIDATRDRTEESTDTSPEERDIDLSPNYSLRFSSGDKCREGATRFALTEAHWPASRR